MYPESSMPLPKDFVAASATPLILSILSHGESYGYDIIQQVRRLSKGDIEWADGMLYPILHRLEKKGLVRSRWGKAESGRRRKYYGLCQSGLEELKTQRQHWQTMNSMLQGLRGGEVCLT